MNRPPSVRAGEDGPSLCGRESNFIQFAAMTLQKSALEKEGRKEGANDGAVRSVVRPPLEVYAVQIEWRGVRQCT